jgi:hypothetical protein
MDERLELKLTLQSDFTARTLSKVTLFSFFFNQKDAKFSQSIYFYKLLYKFQAVSPPIIRSTKLYTQRQVLSN